MLRDYPAFSASACSQGTEARSTRRQMRTLGWLLQVLGLMLVGAALGVGLIYGQVRMELALLGIGGVVFVTGRLIGRP